MWYLEIFKRHTVECRKAQSAYNRNRKQWSRAINKRNRMEFSSEPTAKDSKKFLVEVRDENLRITECMSRESMLFETLLLEHSKCGFTENKFESKKDPE